MTYANSRPMYDADSHIMEIPGWLERHADPSIRERLPPLGLNKAGTATYESIERAVESTKTRAEQGTPIVNVIAGAKGWQAPGAFDPAERSRALDDLGFSRQLVFSTFAGGQYLRHEDLDVRYGGLHAHNLAIAEFCRDDPRLIAVGQISLLDPARAVVEIEAGAKAGCGAFWVPAMPAGDRSPGHPDVDPVWQALCDAHTPFMVHVGPNTQFMAKEYLNNGRPLPPDIVGGGENLRVRDFMVLSFAPQVFLTALVFDGVFERFPKLRGGVIELGAGWVPQFLRSLDVGQKIFARSDPQVGELPMKASDYIRRQVRFTPFPSEDVGRLIREAGAELFMFSSDYPHPEGTDDPVGRFEKKMRDVDDRQKEQFYSKNFEGARVELDGQTTSRFDQRDGTASGAWGAVGKRGRVFIAASYFRRSELIASQRDWTKDGYISSQGYPGSFIVGTQTVADPACTSVPGSAITQGVAGPICSFQYRRFASLSPEVERANAFGSGEYDITKHLTFFGEILASRLRGGYISSPAFPVPPPFLTVPANHIDNPFGQDVQAIIRPVGAEAGGSRAATDDDTLRGVVGLKGDFEDAAANTVFEGWEWEAYLSLAADRSRFLLPDTLRGPIQDALNSCSNPADLSGCYNPFYSSVNGTGTPNSTALINSFYGAQSSVTDSQMQTYNLGLTGPLFALPGGDLGVALGGEVRREMRSTTLDHDATQNRYSFLIGNTDSKAERAVYAGYLELGLPLFHGVRLQTAGRIEHYTDIDRSALSPSAGLTLTPAEMVGKKRAAPAVRQLQFRGTVTSAFRAPNLYQSFPGYVVQPQALNVTPPLPTYVPVQGFGNPALKPEHALAVSGGFSWSPIDELNFAGDFWYYDYQDRIELENAQQIINQFIQTGMDPRVIVDPTSNQVERVRTKYVNIAGHVVTDGIDFSTFVTFTNKTFGLKTPEERSHKLSLGAIGTYLLTFNYPLSEAARRQIPNTNPPVTLDPAPCKGDTCSAAGIRNFNNVWQAMPRLKVNFPLTWSYLGHSASFITHFISGYKDDVNPRPDGSFDSISPWVTFDLQYGYTLKDVIGRELTARIGVYNLFDADPPRVNGLTTSYDYTLHDPRGRMLFAKLIAQF